MLLFKKRIWPDHIIPVRNIEQNWPKRVVLCRFRADAILPVGDDEPEEGCEENEFDGEMKAVEDFLEAWVGVPRRAQLHADPGERVAPGPGADEGVDVEAELVHLRV